MLCRRVIILFAALLAAFNCPARTNNLDETIDGYRVFIETDNDAIFSRLQKKSGLEMITQIIRNICLFEEEVNGRSLTPGMIFTLSPFNSRQGLFPGLNISLRDDRTMVKFYQIKRVLISKRMVTRLVLNERTPQTEEMNQYAIYNVSYDVNGNLTKRLIVKCREKPDTTLPGGFQKFLEGKVIEYKSHNPSGVPGSCIFSRFILNRNGEKTIVETKEALGRTFNDKGQLTGQTTRETRYSYSGVTSRQAFYNPVFDEKGRLCSFDLITSQNPDESPPAGALQLEVRLSGYNGNDLPLEKTFKYYRISHNGKKYICGKIIRVELDKKFLIQSFSSNEFDIMQGTSGDTDAERKYTNSFYVFNRMYDDLMRPAQRRVIHSHYIDAGDMKTRSRIFDSLREVRYEYNPAQTMKKMTVNYKGYDKGQWKDVRIISVELTRALPTGEPAEIILSIVPPEDPDQAFTQTIAEDCSYVLDELEYGTLFTPSSANNGQNIIKEILGNGMPAIQTA